MRAESKVRLILSSQRYFYVHGFTKLARDLLPVYDNLKSQIDSVTDEQRTVASGLIEGVELTLRELLNVFGSV